MLIFASIVLACFVLGALLINPKVGALLVWPIIFAYPHLYMSRLDLLPWNAGVDDLFICIWFLIVVVRRNLFGGIPLRLGLTCWGALTFFALAVVAYASGWTLLPELAPQDVMKPVLKEIIFVLFAYALVHSIDGEEDLRRTIMAFFVGLGLAACTVILHKLYPSYFAIFSGEKYEQYRRATGQVVRAVGSFLEPNIGAIVMGMVVVLSLCSFRIYGSAGRAALVVIVLLLLLASVMTKSRTGGIALACALSCMALLSRVRAYAGSLLLGILFLALLSPQLLQEFWDRLAMAYNPELHEWGGTATSRVWAWRSFLDSATPQVWLFGQSELVGTLRVGLHAHNTYVAALFYYGVGGVLWFVCFFGVLCKHAFELSRIGEGPTRLIAGGVLWSMLVWAIGGLAQDLLTTHTAHLTWLFLAAVVERCHVLSPGGNAVKAADMHLRVPTMYFTRQVCL